MLNSEKPSRSGVEHRNHRARCGGPSTFSIRRYNSPDDTEVLRDLINRSLRGLSGHLHSKVAFDRHERHLRSDAFALELDAMSFWVVVDVGNSVRGCGGWAADPSCTAARIREVFVDPDASRCGAGSLLVSEAIIDARLAGFELIWVSSSQYAVPFYESLGFVTNGPPSTDNLPSVVKCRGVV